MVQTWRMLIPIFEELLVYMDGMVKFLKVDVDRNLEIANKYNIVNIPTMVILKHGGKRYVVTDFSPKRRKFKKILKNIYKRRD